MPETLDGTYEQSLRRIDKQKQDFAFRLFQCLVVSKRPLLVEELGELFAIQPDVDTIPTFDARCRPENPEEFVLSACSTLVAVVNNGDEKIVQFSHFSVRVYLTSDRIAISEHVSRFHVLPRPAHALLASACRSVLLHLDERIVRDKIYGFPLASYAAQYWVDHAQFEDVATEIQHGMECLFDKDKPYFVAWNLLYNIDDRCSYRKLPRSIPLYYAALCGFRHLAEHLVDAHPQDVNARGGMHVTPLHAAVDKGHLGVAMLLLERGADIESRGSRTRTPLHMASYCGYADVVSLLIDHGADLNTETNNWETPLYLASEHGRKDAARSLLEHGADPNHQNAEGFTPLRAAWKEGHVDNVRLLLNYGADAKSPDNRGNSPLHVVLQGGGGDTDIKNILLLDPPDPPLRNLNPLFLEHRLDIVKLLLEHGADANHLDGSGETPLHIALQGGLIKFASQGDFIEIVRLLLHHGADANHLDGSRKTPLHIVLRGGLINSASRGDSIEIVRLLLHHGADANHLDGSRKTPLHIALDGSLINSASHGDFIEIVRLLLHRCADANHPCIFGITPLHLALRTGHNEIIRLLLDLPGIDSWTSLHAASQKGHNNIVRSLLNHGVDANHSDSDGWTALHTASQEGQDDIVRLLLDHRADANRSDNDGWSPLHVAVSPNGRDTVVQL